VVLLLPLVLLGGVGVVYWHLSEVHAAGDLRFYLLVQLYPLAAIPLLMLLFPPRYTRSADLIAALLCYLLAKALELLDAQVYAQGGLVSGHTLKHLVAGLSGWWLLYMVMKRQPILETSPAGICASRAPSLSFSFPQRDSDGRQESTDEPKDTASSSSATDKP
jgi:hypothetical protein